MPRIALWMTCETFLPPSATLDTIPTTKRLKPVTLHQLGDFRLVHAPFGTTDRFRRGDLRLRRLAEIIFSILALLGGWRYPKGLPPSRSNKLGEIV